MSTLMRVTRMLSRLKEGCNSIEMHVVRNHSNKGDGPNDPQGGGWARVDLSRDETIAMMRLALSSRFLSSCKTRQSRFQSSHIRDMTLERFLDVRRSGSAASERVESGTLLGVCDMRQSDSDADTEAGAEAEAEAGAGAGAYTGAEAGAGVHLSDAVPLPLVWMEWNKQRLPQAAFPCIVQRHDVRHCVRREIMCGDSVALFFETHMNQTSKSVYRIWIHVTDLKDLRAVALGVTRALDGLGING